MKQNTVYYWVRTIKGESYLVPVPKEDISDGVTEIVLQAVLEQPATPEEVVLWIK